MAQMRSTFELIILLVCMKNHMFRDVKSLHGLNYCVYMQNH